MTYRDLIQSWAKKTGNPYTNYSNLHDDDVNHETKLIVLAFCSSGEVLIKEYNQSQTIEEAVSDIDCEMMWNSELNIDTDEDPVRCMVFQRQCDGCNAIHTLDTTTSSQCYVVPTAICEFERRLWTLREGLWDIEFIAGLGEGEAVDIEPTGRADEIRTKFYNMLDAVIKKNIAV